MYKSVDPKVDFPKQEEEVLSFWEKNDTFKKSLSQREGAEDYVFYDGPPFAHTLDTLFRQQLRTLFLVTKPCAVSMLPVVLVGTVTVFQ